MTWRAAYRTAARVSLAQVHRFQNIPLERSWSGHVDDSRLPIMGVVTPSEGVRPSSSGRFERETLLQVALKRSGGASLEDDLDLDAEAIEAAVFAALINPSVQCFPAEISTSINGDGARRLGTVVVTFRILSWRAAPGH